MIPSYRKLNLLGGKWGSPDWSNERGIDCFSENGANKLLTLFFGIIGALLPFISPLWNYLGFPLAQVAYNLA